MIGTLHIKNIGIIDDLSIDLNKGLNVLTGETGAGKTLIIDSLQIISGGRFSKEMMRKGTNQSFVELCLDEPEDENSVDGAIIISREINSNGKNMCKINGRMVTVNELKKFMENYIEIHGQNDNQNLLNEKMHINYLDLYAGEKLKKEKEEYTKLYKRYTEIKSELELNYGDEKEKQRRLDLLKYQYDEIENANLKEEEEDELNEKRKIMQNSEKITKNLWEADKLISENGIEILSSATSLLDKIEEYDSKYEQANSALKSLYYELQEIARDVSSYREEIYFDEEERNQVEERLDLIFDLKRKYGNSVQEILDYKSETEQEIRRIENLEEHNQKLKLELKNIETSMQDYADKMHKLRKEYAQKLSENINNELTDLEMRNAKINVHVDYNENQFFKSGKDNVSMFIATNFGEDEKELAKIASGGEMSRTMLAIKTVLADTDKMPVMVFDEIDTGISGKAANSVANKLKNISKKHQVMCISHLPNVAAKADYNYFISKNVEDERTRTNIKLLNEKETINEIARISAGEITEESIQYASKLRHQT